jgi:hypothetical protein
MKYLALVVRYELVIQREDAPSMKAGDGGHRRNGAPHELCSGPEYKPSRGNGAPVVSSEKSNVKLESGTSMLLRVKQ